MIHNRKKVGGGGGGGGGLGERWEEDIKKGDLNKA